MNILLWVLQAILALHTAVGAIWKFSNSAGQTQRSLQSIPDEIWQSMGIFELLCSMALIIPVFYDPLALLVPVAALCIVLEMLIFCGIHIYSDHENYNSIIYWLVVAAVSVFIAYGRFISEPL